MKTKLDFLLVSFIYPKKKFLSARADSKPIVINYVPFTPISISIRVLLYLFYDKSDQTRNMTSGLKNSSQISALPKASKTRIGLYHPIKRKSLYLP